jgi:hypothetical protein
MHKARTFFYVCAGLFLLAGAYHLGARSATAQAPGVVEAANFAIPPCTSYWSVTFAANRTLYTSFWLPDGWQVPAQACGWPIPGSAPIAATLGAGSPTGTGTTVLLSNGDLYRNTGAAWEFQGNLLGGPVPRNGAPGGSSRRSTAGP